MDAMGTYLHSSRMKQRHLSRIWTIYVQQHPQHSMARCVQVYTDMLHKLHSLRLNQIRTCFYRQLHQRLRV